MSKKNRYEELKKKAMKRKDGIANQILTKIRRVVIIIFEIIALLCIVFVSRIITESNDTELALESTAAAYEMENYFGPFKRMVEQQAIDSEVRFYMKTLFKSVNTKKHSGYHGILSRLQSTQAIDPDNILGAWIADDDASMVAISDGFVSEEGWDITSRPWYQCVNLGKTIFTTPYVDVSTGNLVITVAYTAESVLMQPV